MCVTSNHQLMARQMSTQDLFIIFGLQCAAQVTDIVSDYMLDENLIHNEGLPDKAKLLNMMIDQAIAVTPDITADTLSDAPESIRPRSTNQLENMIGAIFYEMMRKNPRLFDITYRPPGNIG